MLCVIQNVIILTSRETDKLLCTSESFVIGKCRILGVSWMLPMTVFNYLLSSSFYNQCINILTFKCNYIFYTLCLTHYKFQYRSNFFEINFIISRIAVINLFVNPYYVIFIFFSCFIALKVKLMLRRPLNQLVAQGIMPRKYYFILLQNICIVAFGG